MVTWGCEIQSSLTELEQLALSARINLADGHPRQCLTEGQNRIIARLPALFEESLDEPFERLNERVQTKFLLALGQKNAPIARGRVFSVYSSSVAIMILAACLGRRGGKAALIHPTFDNIHDLCAPFLPIVPISEAALQKSQISEIQHSGVSCVFVTTPNNPTGWSLDQAALRRLASACAAGGVILCMDVSFRGFDTRTQFDCFEILEDVGVQYAVIEDTGKLWPVSELKLSFVAVSSGLKDQFARAASDVLLNVSPFVLRLVEELTLDGVAGGFGLLHRLIATNRTAVLSAITDLEGVGLPDRDSRVSVCRVEFGSAERAGAVRRSLHSAGVHVLPCNQFYWACPEEGGKYLRVALARDEKALEEGLRRLRHVAARQRDFAVASQP